VAHSVPVATAKRRLQHTWRGRAELFSDPPAGIWIGTRAEREQLRWKKSSMVNKFEVGIDKEIEQLNNCSVIDTMTVLVLIEQISNFYVVGRNAEVEPKVADSEADVVGESVCDDPFRMRCLAAMSSWKAG
jgi:hypothetical protein